MGKVGTFEIEGLADLDAKLGELGLSAGKGVLRRVGRAALQLFDQAWRAQAPELTGRLKKSGGVGSKLSKRVRKANVRENTVEIFAGPGPHPEAVQQEFGNSHNAAQPFARPAWDQTQDAALNIVKTELGGEIMKTAARKAVRDARKAARAAADDDA